MPTLFTSREVGESPVFLGEYLFLSATICRHRRARLVAQGGVHVSVRCACQMPQRVFRWGRHTALLPAITPRASQGPLRASCFSRSRLRGSSRACSANRRFRATRSSAGSASTCCWGCGSRSLSPAIPAIPRDRCPQRSLSVLPRSLRTLRLEGRLKPECIDK